MISRLADARRLFRKLRPLFVGALVFGTASAHGAELKLVSRAEMIPVLAALAPQMQDVTGSALAIGVATPGAYGRRLSEPFDVAIVDGSTAETLIKQGKVAAGLSCLGWTGLGVAVGPRAAQPDIGSVDGLRRILLATRSIAFSGDDESGAGVRAVLWQLGIAEQVEAKLIDSGNDHPATLVANGSADLAIAWQSELIAAPGIQAAGLLPADVQHFTTFVAALSSEPADTNAALRLVSFLTSLTGTKALRTIGLEAAVTEW